MSVPITPTPFADQKGNTSRWITLHKMFMETGTRANPKIIFMGDCLFNTKYELKLWTKLFSKLNCLTFAIRDDRIENLLWRIQGGELQYTQPKILVLNIGRNDLKVCAPWTIADGILQCVRMIREKLPSTYIIVPSFSHKSYRDIYEYKNDKFVNSTLKTKIANMEGVYLVKITKKIHKNSVSLDKKGGVKVAKDFWGLYRKIISILIEKK